MTNYLAPKTSLRPKSRKDSKGYEPLVEEGSTRGLFPLSKPTADDMRKKGMVKKTTNNLKTSPRPVGRNDAAEAKAVEGGNRESARVAREDPMYLRPKARKNKK